LESVQSVYGRVRPCAEECGRCSAGPRPWVKIVVVMSSKTSVKEARLRQLEPYCSHKWML
jgi:hypothetical protein